VSCTGATVDTEKYQKLIKYLNDKLSDCQTWNWPNIDIKLIKYVLERSMVIRKRREGHYHHLIVVIVTAVSEVQIRNTEWGLWAETMRRRNDHNQKRLRYSKGKAKSLIKFLYETEKN